jgi:hypothetical protein
MNCHKCRTTNEVTHFIHTDGCIQELCCQCYVSAGNVPHTDHPDCLKAAKELRKAQNVKS